MLSLTSWTWVSFWKVLPVLILPSGQINMRTGHLPEPGHNDLRHLKIPLARCKLIQGVLPMSNPIKATHTVVIVGGGAGGATVASLLLKQRPGLDVPIIEPADTHWYRPA